MKYYYFGRNLKNLIFNIAFLIVLEDEESGIEYADNMDIEVKKMKRKKNRLFYDKFI